MFVTDQENTTNDQVNNKDIQDDDYVESLKSQLVRADETINVLHRMVAMLEQENAYLCNDIKEGDSGGEDGTKAYRFHAEDNCGDCVRLQHDSDRDQNQHVGKVQSGGGTVGSDTFFP